MAILALLKFLTVFTIGTCDSSNALFQCLSIDTVVVVKYSPGVPLGSLRFDILSFEAEVTEGINSIFKASYVGEVPTSSMIKITLDSKGEATEMESSQKNAFEGSTEKFFQDTLKDLGVTVLGVEVKSQSVKKRQRDRRSLLERILGGDGITSSVEIESEVFAEYKPPPELDFKHVVEEVITQKADVLTYEVKSADPYFENFEDVTAETVETMPPTVAPPPQKSISEILVDIQWAIPVMVIGICVIVFLCGCVGFNRYLRKKREEKYGDIISSNSLDHLKSDEGETFFSWITEMITRRRRSTRSSITKSIFDTQKAAKGWSNKKKRTSQRKSRVSYASKEEVSDSDVLPISEIHAALPLDETGGKGVDNFQQLWEDSPSIPLSHGRARGQEADLLGLGELR